jgi:Domain of unknown function (DUF4383)
MTTQAGTGGGSPRALNVLLGFGLGAVYLLIGLVGFTVSGGYGFASHDGGKLLGLFMVNPLHNVVHLLVGVLLLVGAYAGVRMARGINLLVGAVYLLVGVLGLFLLNSTANILALNSADNVLHLGSALVLVAVALTQDRTVTAA